MLPDWTQPLTQGAQDPGSPWRNLALGTVGLDGAPQIRTVVLRSFQGLSLEVHTDTRSAKYAELQARPAAALHGWNPASRIQLRVSGPASLHVGDAAAAQSWAALRAASRATYRVQPGPGARLPAHATPDATDAAALRVFCVIRVAIRAVDWLHLAEGGHRRCRFTWEDGGLSGAWVVP